MPLLGTGVMVLLFDLASDSIVVEHDDWHSHEHLPERLSIPGFLRGTRWTALSGNPRYLVLYEVREVGILASAPYRERLNNPSPWTAKMMVHYRGMVRSFCRVAGSFGAGLGHVALVVRLSPAPGKAAMSRERLTQQLLRVLRDISVRPGVASAHLLETALMPEMTNEQRIRGKDAVADWFVLVTGYHADSVIALARDELSGTRLEECGAVQDHTAAIYRAEHSLTDRDVRAPSPD